MISNRCVLAASLFLAVLLLGCAEKTSEKEVIKTVYSLPEVNQFLEENPEAEVTTIFLDAEGTKSKLKFIRAQCGNDFPEGAHWRARLVGKKEHFLAYFPQNSKKPTCITIVDNAASAGLPAQFVNPILPPPACTNDGDCFDNNPSTRDSCSQATGACLHELESCAGQGGAACSYYSECPSPFMPSSDSNRCCASKCVYADLCEGVACGILEKCVNGLCVKKNCVEIGGRECPLLQACSGNYYSTTDAQGCCIGQCVARQTCASTVCGAREKCVSGACVQKNCAELGGIACVLGDSCPVGFISSSESSRCCLVACQSPQPSPSPSSPTTQPSATPTLLQAVSPSPFFPNASPAPMPAPSQLPTPTTSSQPLPKPAPDLKQCGETTLLLPSGLEGQAALVCLGKSLLDGCAPATAVLRVPFNEDAVFQLAQSESAKCIARIAFPEIEKIKDPRNLELAGKFSECLLDLNTLASRLSVEQGFILNDNPGRLAFLAYVETALNVALSNSKCSGELLGKPPFIIPDLKSFR